MSAAVVNDPTQIVRDWRAAFGKALAARDDAAVAELFQPNECYWRDFVCFTWNIATMDGRDAIRAMLKQQLGAVLPVNITPEREATSADGIVQGWFDFETRVARGKGHVRLK